MVVIPAVTMRLRLIAQSSLVLPVVVAAPRRVLVTVRVLTCVVVDVAMAMRMAVIVDVSMTTETVLSLAAAISAVMLSTDCCVLTLRTTNSALSAIWVTDPAISAPSGARFSVSDLL